eukprot:Gb_31139 [translate_table: standard]
MHKDDDKGKGGESPRSHELLGRYLLLDLIREPLQLPGSYRFPRRACTASCQNDDKADVGHSNLNTWQKKPYSRILASRITFSLPVMITNEGAKWAARIMARRLIGMEANTYLSHQWVAVAAKVNEGTVYAWALWAQTLMVTDHPLMSPMAQYSYWAVNKAHFVRESYNIEWSPPDLQLVMFPEVQEKASTTRKEKEKKKPSTKDSKSTKRKHSKLGSAAQGHSPLNAQQGTSGEEQKRKKFDDAQGHKSRKENRKDSSISQEVITTIPQKDSNKHGSTYSYSTSSHPNPFDPIGELGTLPSIDQATMATKVLLNLCPHVHLLREKALVAKEAPPIPLAMQAKLSQLEFNVVGLKGQIFGDSIQLFKRERIIDEMQLKAEKKDEEIVEHIEKIRKLKAVPAQLVTDSRLAASKVALEEGLIGKGSMSWWAHEKHGIDVELEVWMDHMVKEHPLPTTSQVLLVLPSTETGKKISEAPPTEDQTRLLSDTSLHIRDQIIEYNREGETSRSDKEPGLTTPSKEGPGVLVVATTLLEEQPPRSSGKELEIERVLATLHLPNIPEVGPSHAMCPDLSEHTLEVARSLKDEARSKTAGPQQDPKMLVVTVPLVPLIATPPGFSKLHTLPQTRCESPPNGTNDVERFEVVPSIAQLS